MRVTSKGQVTIPIRIREKLGIKPNSEVEFVEQPEGVKLVKVSEKTYRQRLEELRGSIKDGITTDEFMQLMRGE